MRDLPLNHPFQLSLVDLKGATFPLRVRFRHGDTYGSEYTLLSLDGLDEEKRIWRSVYHSSVGPITSILYLADCGVMPYHGGKWNICNWLDWSDKEPISITAFLCHKVPCT